MAIPVFVSQIVPATTDTVRVNAGSIQTIPATAYYFYVSSKSTAGNGRSFLSQLKASADASTAVVWTFVLTTDLKLRATHDSGGSVDLILNRLLAWNLGYATTYPVDATLTHTIAVPTGASGYTATYRSPFLWCPERWVSMVGPELFDPVVSPGIKRSAGTASRSPDSTASYVSNGIQVEATYTFTGVEYLYRSRATDFYAADPHEREDYETHWSLGFRVGRRTLLWKDKTQITGSAAPTGLTGQIPRYYEYYPDNATRGAPQIVAAAPPLLTFHHVTVGLWLTERGIAIYG